MNYVYLKESPYTYIQHSAIIYLGTDLGGCRVGRRTGRKDGWPERVGHKYTHKRRRVRVSDDRENGFPPRLRLCVYIYI